VSPLKAPPTTQRGFIRETSGFIFSNGIIEVVASEIYEDGLRLLLWKDSHAHIDPSITLEQRRESGTASEDQTVTFEPIRLDASMLAAMRFPSHADSFGTSRQLLDSICKVIQQYTNLDNDLVLLAAHAVRASWFPEALSSPLGLVICGPRSPQSQQLFRVLSCMYRRSLLLGDISRAAICSLPMDLSPTLFIECYEHTSRLQKLIRATCNGGYVPSKGKLLRTSCTTVSCTDTPLAGIIPGWNALEIPVSYTRAPLPRLKPDAEEEIAAAFQPKLLMYRLMNYRSVMNSSFEDASFASPADEIVRCLGSCVVDDPERQVELVSLIRERCDQSEQESWDPCVTVLEALLSLSHKSAVQSVHVAEIATVVNSILKQRDESLEMNARALSDKLKLLGLRTSRLDSAGRGLLLTKDLRRLIHRLAWNNRAQFPPDGENNCDLCRQLQSQEGQESEKTGDELDKMATS
jgi:hypothetical protein